MTCGSAFQPGEGPSLRPLAGAPGKNWGTGHGRQRRPAPAPAARPGRSGTGTGGRRLSGPAAPQQDGRAGRGAHRTRTARRAGPGGEKRKVEPDLVHPRSEVHDRGRRITVTVDGKTVKDREDGQARQGARTPGAGARGVRPAGHGSAGRCHRTTGPRRQQSPASPSLPVPSAGAGTGLARRCRWSGSSAWNRRGSHRPRIGRRSPGDAKDPLTETAHIGTGGLLRARCRLLG